MRLVSEHVTFSRQGTKQFVQLSSAHFLRVGLAFRNYATWFSPMRSLDVNLSSGLVDVEAEIVIAKCVKQIGDEPREEVATIIVMRRQRAAIRRHPTV